MAGKHKKQRQTIDPQTGRFQSVLTPQLVDKLCETHRDGMDYRNVTAVRCGVHPKLLTAWLKLGERDETSGLAADLFLRMGAIEGDIRAGLLKEAADPTASIEQTEFDNGKPVSKTLTSRRTSGVQWLLERRFRQFRLEYVLTEHEQDALSLFQPQPSAMTLEMAETICRQLAAAPDRLPPAIRALFAATDWGAGAPPSALKDSHGETETTH